MASLHKEIYKLKNGTKRPFVEVRLGGKRVGELSNVTSAHPLPLLEHTEAVGETALAYARTTGSALAAQLVLHAAKATEISNDWLATGPHPARCSCRWPRLLFSSPDSFHNRRAIAVVAVRAAMVRVRAVASPSIVQA